MYKVKKKLKEPGLFKLDTGELLVKASARVSIDGELKPRTKCTTVPAGTSIKEVRRLKEKMKAELRMKYEAKATRVEEAVKATTVREWSERWLDWKESRGRKASVLDRYRRDLETKILPHIGKIRFEDLSRGDVVNWVAWAEQAKKPDGEVYAISCARSWWAILKPMLQDAYAEGYLDKDVTFRVVGPEIKHAHRVKGLTRERRTLSAEQIAEMLVIVRNKHEARLPEVAMLAFTGMRPGELYALRWKHIDLDEGTLVIEESVWRGFIDTTKTGERRETALPWLVVDLLNRQKDWLEDRPLARKTGLVFPSVKGTPRCQASLTHVWKTVNAEASHDIRLSCQVLRRTFNTLMRRSEVHDNVIRAMIGHADERMTRLYDGVDMADKQAAVERVFEVVTTAGNNRES